MTHCRIGVILVAGLVLRLVFLVVNLEVTTLPQGGADAKRFERDAWNIVEFGRADFVHYLESGSEFIVLVGSFIYSVTGRAPYVLGLIMVLLGVGVIYLSYRAALELWGDERMARIVAWSAALFPQLVLHSVLFLREIPVSFCLAAAALFAVRFVKRNDLAQAVLFAGCVVIGALFHSGVIFALPALLLGMMLARPRGQRGKAKYYAVNTAAALVLVGAVYTANETGFGLGKFGGSLEGALEQFEQQELHGTEGGAAYPEWMRVRGGLSDAWKIPIRFIALVFAPIVPLMVRSPGHLLGVIDAALYMFLFWSLFRNWGAIKKNRAVIILLVVLLTLFLVYALGVSNFGTGIRHRAKMSPILLLLAAGLPYLRRRRRRERKLQIARANQLVAS